jgi:hypothetical protein
MISTVNAIATIASAASKAIAGAGHKGHDLETVGERITAAIPTIRECYTAQLAKGKTPKDAAELTGQIMIASYCRTFGI